MYPIMCRNCANEVLVKKNSLAQTSVQWADSSACAEFAALDGLQARATARTCLELRASIEAAVTSGVLKVGESLD